MAFGQNLNFNETDHRNELTRAVDSLSQQIEEGQITSFGALIVLISKPPYCIAGSLCFSEHSDKYIHVGNFPWMIPVLRFFYLCSSRSESFRCLNKIALDLVKGRRESAIKVNHF